ncbi:bile acid:sodium symporter family protein [Actinoplanes sp. ATCC 53533]|uniref:bile acid:sodium symporter family protein n=1 Tax=Actinoplanes sp. ATCC 53533 TaxID=1288362 RepID=UPI002104E923|nr:bile acid:sodium symporter family protein [Actinoplanes sp. ATCC 53533]
MQDVLPTRGLRRGGNGGRVRHARDDAGGRGTQSRPSARLVRNPGKPVGPPRGCYRRDNSRPGFVSTVPITASVIHQPEGMAESTFLTLVLLPLALGIVMLGLGLSLTVADFSRVLRYPRAVLVALVCQVIVLPGVCFGLVLAFGLRPGLAVGMMLLAASPGGTTASLFSYLFRGDVALNVTLTAVNSVVAVVTLPLVVNFSVAYFTGDPRVIGLQFDKVAQVFAIVLVPVAVGMWLRNRLPRAAAAAERPVKIFSAVVLAAVIVGAVLAERSHLADYLAAVGVVALLFSVLSLGLGYAAPRLLRVERTQAIACSMEIGIHNSTLAITVALSPQLLDNAEMAVPAAVYGLLMFLTATAFGLLITRAAARRGEPQPA